MLCVHTRPEWMPRPRRPATEISQSVVATLDPASPYLNGGHGVAVQPVQNQSSPNCSDKMARNLIIMRITISSLMAPSIPEAPTAQSGTSSRWESDSFTHRSRRPSPDLTFVVISCPAVMTPLPPTPNEMTFQWPGSGGSDASPRKKQSIAPLQ